MKGGGVTVKLVIMFEHCKRKQVFGWGHQRRFGVVLFIMQEGGGVAVKLVLLFGCFKRIPQTFWWGYFHQKSFGVRGGVSCQVSHIV